MIKSQSFMLQIRRPRLREGGELPNDTQRFMRRAQAGLASQALELLS